VVINVIDFYDKFYNMLQCETENILFTEIWIERFVEYWNLFVVTSNKMCLNCTGPVLFGLADSGKIIRSKVLCWNNTGIVNVVKNISYSDAIPSFVASAKVWESVFYMRCKPFDAIAAKQMQFCGNIKFAMQFSTLFKDIAAIAGKVNSTF
jgi:hypothetical protein